MNFFCLYFGQFIVIYEAKSSQFLFLMIETNHKEYILQLHNYLHKLGWNSFTIFFINALLSNPIYLSLNTVANIKFIPINILRTTDLHDNLLCAYRASKNLTCITHCNIILPAQLSLLDVNSSVVRFILVQVIHNDLHSNM